jgi:glycosyltransferase involved in cell wall biosynthesis
MIQDSFEILFLALDSPWPAHSGAMAAGKPVIATDVGGIPDLLRNGLDGLLIPAKDPLALVNVLDFMIKHPSEVEKMGQNAMMLVKKDFSVSRTVDLMRKVYLEVV